MTIQQLADKIERLTDENNHTEARVLLANYLGGQYPEVMGKVKAIHDKKGHLTDDAHEIRKAVTKQMINEMRFRFGDAAADIVKSSF
jgi:hypothetical protein